MKWLLKRRQGVFPEEEKVIAGKTFQLSCPHCQFQQEVLMNGISTFCKSCRKVIHIEKVVQPRSLTERPRQDLKVARCFKCGSEQTIPHHALSTFCKKCGKRINLQNYKINGKFNGVLETLGELHVTSSGELRSNIICGSAIVEGKINGSLRAFQKVELRQTAEMNGSIEAGALVMEDGAAFRGASKIQPV